MDFERLANKARRSISKYCMEECKAYCCRKGYLILSNKEILKVFKNDVNAIVENAKYIKLLPSKKYSFNLSREGQGCPALNSNFTCSIHKSKTRSKTCADFPLFLKGKKVLLSPRCPAVKENKLYPYIAIFIKHGFEIAKTNPFAEMEVNNMIKIEKKD